MKDLYPAKFPEKSRSRVLAEQIQGGRVFDTAKQKARSVSDVEELLRSYILRVFLVFVREASELVPLKIWSLGRLESESLEFLRLFTISACYERGCLANGQKVGNMVSNWNGSILEVVERAFRKSAEWQEYEDILLAAVTAPKTFLNSESQSDAGIGVQQTKKLHWEDIEIAFLSDEPVQVQVQTQLHTYNYAEMNFKDKRTGKPNQAWALLRELAQHRGEIPPESRNSKDFIAREKRMERMRQTLRAHFQIASDPILRDERGYRCRFKIWLAPAFRT